jgi:hypothetical protein
MLRWEIQIAARAIGAPSLDSGSALQQFARNKGAGNLSRLALLLPATQD